MTCSLVNHDSEHHPPAEPKKRVDRWEQERLDRIAKEEADRAERKAKAELDYRRDKEERESRERLEMAKLLLATIAPKN